MEENTQRGLAKLTLYIFYATILYSQIINTNLLHCIIYLLVSSYMFQPSLMRHFQGNFYNVCKICFNLTTSVSHMINIDAVMVKIHYDMYDIQYSTKL